MPSVNTEPRSFLRPGMLLQLEALVCLAISCTLYFHLFPHAWLLFALLFLAPDVSLLPYMVSNGRASTVFYNSLHSEVLPLLLGILCWRVGSPLGVQCALIWLAHIGMDRALGYGLKYLGKFRPTHLQAA